MKNIIALIFLLISLPACGTDVTPQDNWEQVVADGGEVNFTGGVYVATDPIVINNIVHLIAASPSTIVGSWVVNPGAELWIEGFDLEPVAGEKLFLSKLGWIQIGDSVINAHSSVPILVQTYGGVFKMYSKNRRTVWNVSNVQKDVFDFDSGTAVKVLGNINGLGVEIRVSNTSANVFTLDQSTMMAAGLKMYGEECTAKAFDVRRASQLIIQDINNRIDCFNRGITARQNSLVDIDNIKIVNISNVALWIIRSGKIAYSNVIFSNNNKNTKISNEATILEN